MDVQSGQLAAEVFDRRFTYELGEGGQVYGVLGMSPEGRLRFLTYGTAANDKLRNGAVRLLVRTAPAPAELTGYGIWQQPDWRTLATAYDGVLLPQDCIGGPCFEFPDAALEAIRAIGFEEDAELWLSGDPASVPPATSKSYLRNAVYLSMLRRTMGEVPAVD